MFLLMNKLHLGIMALENCRFYNAKKKSVAYVFNYNFIRNVLKKFVLDPNLLWENCRIRMIATGEDTKSPQRIRMKRMGTSKR